MCRSTTWTAALIAGAALTVSCASAPPPPPVPPAPESKSELADNHALASTVSRHLNADPLYYFNHVDVRADNGVVYLSGYVWSTDAIYRARRVALSVPGVKDVRTNQLQLERNGRDSGSAR
jgi:osmotically-inducible protein OsmY